MLSLKQLFCRHKFSVCGNIPCTVNDLKGPIKNVDILFLECKKCGKRKTLKSKKSDYASNTWQIIKLWEAHELGINFEDFKRNKS